MALSRWTNATYGALALLISTAALLRAAPLVSVFVGPSSGGEPTLDAILVDVSLVALFGLQHSVMARPFFKSAYRSRFGDSTFAATYTLASSLVLGLLLWQWRTVPGVLWRVDAATPAALLRIASLAGWALVVVSFAVMNAPRLLGAEQIVAVLRRRPVPVPEFRTPGPYRWVRHPILLGFLVGLWVTPVMNGDRLVLAAAMSAYIAVGIVLEERDLVAELGDAYREYRRRVPALLPGRRRGD